MKLFRIGLRSNTPGAGKLVRRFGYARLVRLSSGRLELRGGSSGDRGQAREWISLFGHHLMVDCRPVGSSEVASLLTRN